MNKDKKKPVLKLSGADGNAFMIIGLAKRAAQKAQMNPTDITAMVTEMMSGDYDNLIQTAMKHFEVE
jgi:hypothetical protein